MSKHALTIGDLMHQDSSKRVIWDQQKISLGEPYEPKVDTYAVFGRPKPFSLHEGIFRNQAQGFLADYCRASRELGLASYENGVLSYDNPLTEVDPTSLKAIVA